MEEEIRPLDGLEGIFDLVVSGEDQKEPDAARLLFQTIEQRYQNSGLLDQGGMKLIYTNFDAFCQRSIARAELKSSKQSVGKFINEARILARLEHSNIVPLYDLGLDEEGEPYFTMRLLGGQNLQELINKISRDKQNPGQETLLEIFLKVCDAIAYAHSCGVVHLDLKPANIQVEEFGEVLVCDWGLARYLEGREPEPEMAEAPEIFDEHTIDGQIKGSPGYMAPEQVNPKLGPRNEKTDVYSLGAVLYCLLTYQAPIARGTVRGLIKQTLEGDFPEPRQCRPDLNIPKSLNAVVLKAMATDPNQRYSSIQALADDVRAYKNGFATRAEEASFLTLASLMIKRYKRVFYVMSLSVLILMLTVAVFLTRLQEEKKHVEEALKRSELAEEAARGSEAHALGLVEQLQEEEFEQLKLRRGVIPKLQVYSSLRQLEQNFKDAHYISYYAYNMDRNNLKSLDLYLYSLFGHMEFKGFVEVMSSQNLIEQHFLFEYAQKFNKEGFSASDLVDFIKVLRKTSPLKRKQLEAHLIYSFTEKRSLEERMELVDLLFGLDRVNWKESNGLYELSLCGNKNVDNIYSLRRLPLRVLDLSGTLVTDIKPLHDMPLESVNLSGTHVVEVKYLNGARLRALDISDTPIIHINLGLIRDLKVLKLNDVKRPLGFLKNLINLELIELPKALYSEKDLSVLNPSVKVIYK